MTKNEIQIDQVRKYLAHLSLQARRHLLAETERLQAHGADMPGAGIILAELRREFRATGSAHSGVGNSSRHFFQPLELLLVDSALEHATAGQISREFLSSIWEWISLVALPRLADDYTNTMKHLIAADNRQEAKQVALTFQTKVARSLASALASTNGVERVRSELTVYTGSRAIFDDLSKVLCCLQARDALVEFAKALPAKIEKFEGKTFATVVELLKAFTASHPEAMPFALTLMAKHLRTPWQLVRLATKMAKSKNPTDIAATPWAIAVSMVLEQIDERRLALCHALKDGHVVIAKDILVDIYEIEHALRVRIDRIEESEWGRRLDELMKAVATPVDAEIHSISGPLRHILGSPALHRHDNLTGRLTFLAWKGHDLLAEGAAYCKKLVN
jgi:hypothetical protein